MTKSLIITHIANCDYPLFRQWLGKYYSFFDEIIIHWDIMFRFPFYNTFIQQSLSHIPNIKFLDMTERVFGVDDWRHMATTEMIKHAIGDWIISIEQDWFTRNWKTLFAAMEESMDTSDMFGWWNPTNAPYVHPALWGIKRELLERTSKDFTPHPEINGSDHFAKITYDALDLGAKIDKYEGELLPSSFSFHLGGVNQNYLNFETLLETNSLHRAEIFYVYNYFSKEAMIEQSLKFMETMNYVNTKLAEKFPDIHPEKSEWSIFFR